MSIGDDQVYPGQAAGAQRGQELAPELIGLAVTDGGAQDLTGAVDGHPGGHHQRLRDHMSPDTDLAEGRTQNTYGNSMWDKLRVRNASISLSRPAQILETSDLDTPACTPIAATRSSTLRVDTPCT